MGRSTGSNSQLAILIVEIVVILAINALVPRNVGSILILRLIQDEQLADDASRGLVVSFGFSRFTTNDRLLMAVFCPSFFLIFG